MGKTDRYTDSREAPLYKATVQLLYKVDNLLNFFSRDRKHTLGQRLLNIVLGMLDCVSLAYDFPEQRADQLRLYLTRYNNLATILEMCEKKGYLCHRDKNLYTEIQLLYGLHDTSSELWY